MTEPGWIRIWVAGELVVDEPTDRSTLSTHHERITTRAKRDGALFVVDIRDRNDEPYKHMSNAEDVQA